MRITLLLAAVLLVAPGAMADEHFIPDVVQGEGRDGAWWTTEVWFANTAATTGGYAFVFLPADRPANSEEVQAEPEFEDIVPRGTVYRNDVVPQGSSGALRVLTTPGVVVGARVYNAAGRDSSGHGVPVLSRAQAVRPGEIGHLLGLHRTPQFRANIGLINPNTEPCVVTMTLFTRRGEPGGEQEYRLGPGAVLNLNEALHAFGVARGEHMRLELTGSAPFFAYAQTVDARSGTVTFALAQRQ